MTAIGYVFVFTAVMLIRQVIVGRVAEIGPDLKDFTVSLLSGDIDAANAVAKRRGENVPESSSITGSGTLPIDIPAIDGSRFAHTVVQLGDAASGYRLGGTGPDYYDCSGLIWQALRHEKIYQGSRFTTHSFSRSIAPNIATEVKSRTVGDIVIWDGRHMGVVIGSSDMYSARSTSRGIGLSSIDGDSTYFGFQPRYWRLRHA